MAFKNRLEEGHVVMEFMVGNTQIQICDDYCRNRTQEEVQAILDNVARVATRGYIEQARMEAARS